MLSLYRTGPVPIENVGLIELVSDTPFVGVQLVSSIVYPLGTLRLAVTFMELFAQVFMVSGIEMVVQAIDWANEKEEVRQKAIMAKDQRRIHIIRYNLLSLI